MNLHTLLATEMLVRSDKFDLLMAVDLHYLMLRTEVFFINNL